MSQDYLERPYNELRRKDRAQGDDWVKAFLQRAPVGVMATCYQGQPFLNTRQFVYDPEANAIYLHGAKTGRTLSIIAVNNQVCFSASEMGRLIAADEAVEVSVEFASVVVFGRVQMVTDPAEAEHGLKLLMEKYFPHLKPVEDYRPIEAQDLKITAVLRIDIESWSGKEKKVEGDPPGAFYYGEM